MMHVADRSWLGLPRSRSLPFVSFSLLNSMSTQRIDAFEGSEAEYAVYLLSDLTSTPTEDEHFFVAEDEELDLPQATLDEAMLAFLVATRRKDVAKNSSTFRKIRRDSQAVDLYCAIYVPVFGNYYHWAFAMNPTPNKTRQVDPSSSSSCLQPLIYLGQMRDYVVEIWELLLQYGVIDEAAWNYGYQAMLPYYSQDFGGNDYDEDEDEEDGEDGGGGRILSDAFVYDSDDVT
ncbi:hypothetical protein L249_5740 [Ophiocordyceps polyrhachis-furcata BCC 54312]|uniref:Uncharacterized protein n=1 Tax=Ophiocordyceps polyrhachis-furcata BCC 54312 TaxID=1330021 RepID=A0A367L004_9HYPO|nr:hypothetical protein L249_5740 [Ophiocordyceps polyrhachis-furcata BCC 54312]